MLPCIFCCILQDDLEKLRAELKAKDRNLQTVKREKEEAAAAGEKAITVLIPNHYQ